MKIELYVDKFHLVLKQAFSFSWNTKDLNTIMNIKLSKKITNGIKGESN